MLGFSQRLSQVLCQEYSRPLLKTSSTDTLEPTVQGPSVQKAKECETEYDRQQIKK